MPATRSAVAFNRGLLLRAVPLLIKLVSELSRRRLIALLCSVLGLSIAWQLVLRGDYSETVSWAPYIAPPYRALEFVAGMCLARMLMTGVRLRLPVLAPVALAVAALLAGGISGRG